MIYKNVLPIIVLLILSSCVKQEKDFQNDPINIEIQDNNLKENDYTNIIDSLQVIPLETNSNSIIGGIRKISFKHQKFFIQDKNHNLLVFNENGKFINKLNNKGKGPGEYIELRDFFVDEAGNILILSWKKILTYDSELNFKDDFSFDVKTDTGRELNPIFFIPSEEYFFLFMGSFGMSTIDPGKEMALYCINRKKKILNQFFPVEYNFTHLHKMFYNSNGIINYTNGYGNDTIYAIKHRNLYPKYIIDFKQSKITRGDMLRDRNKLFNKINKDELKGNICKVYENNEFFCFLFYQGRTAKQVVYKKKTRNYKILNILKSRPFPAIVVAGVINNYFFSVVEPYMILQMNKDHYYHDLVSKLEFQGIDNPLIFKYKFKNVE